MQGKLILIYGPSGSGKGELIAHIRATFPELVFPVSCTTRAIRPGEQDGLVYHFISNEVFDSRVSAGEFLEWAEFGGNRYGTLKEEILPALERGKSVLREVDVQGVRAIRAMLPGEQVAVIFIHAGSWEALERRVRARAPITEEELAKRRKRYEDELSYRSEATYEIENKEGALDAAKKEIETLVRSLIS